MRNISPVELRKHSLGVNSSKRESLRRHFNLVEKQNVYK
ncbi:hypothetical protein D3OALGA1CA_5050 [Olavius algarvensis associated proteobacterium Delta 3]|nr:hypothetical protein D3OALGA1CA_5050 [Olavius algarvensis associated proteobacterium Delta 3]